MTTTYVQEEKEDLEREVARLKEGGGEQTRLEELMEVERELKQANKTIQQQVDHFLHSAKCRILRDRTMDNKLMYIPNDYTQNFSIFRYQLVVETQWHST